MNLLTCKRCQRSLPETDFHVDKGHASGRKNNCRRCYNNGQNLVRWCSAMRDVTCDACGSSERLCLDHDHSTLELRGTLCNRCNVALGLLDDDPVRIEALLRYIRSH